MNDISNILKNTPAGIVFSIRLAPNSSINKIADYTENYVRIKIAAPALENRANKELIEFCSKLFDVNKSKISIVSGEKSKLKKVLLKNADFETAEKKLLYELNALNRY